MNNTLDTIARVLCPADPDSIFRGILPDAPNELTSLFEYHSEPPDEYFDQTHFNHNIQVRTRAKTPGRAFSLAQTAMSALHRYTDKEVAIMAKSPVLPIGQDGKQRFEYTVNFSIFKR